MTRRTMPRFGTFLAAALAAALFSSCSDDGSGGVFADVDAQDLEGVWVIQGISDTTGDTFFVTLALEVDAAGVVTSALYKRGPQAFDQRLDIIADADLEVEVQPGDNGTFSIVVEDVSGAGPVTAMSLDGTMAAAVDVFSGTLDITAAGASASNALLTEHSGTIAAATFDAAVAGGLPGDDFHDFDVDGVDASLDGGGAERFVHGTFTQIDASPDSAIRIEIDATATSPTTRDISSAIVLPTGSFSEQVLMTPGMLEALLFGSNYVVGGPIFVAIGLNDAGDPSSTIELSLSQAGEDP